MAAGFIVVLFAASVGITSGGIFGLLVSSFVGILAGIGLIFAEVQAAPGLGPAVFAFAGRRLSFAGLLVASCAVTAVSGEAVPAEICFGMLALLVLGIFLIIIGIRGG